MDLDYIGLAPGFVSEVLEIYGRWEGRETVPMKVKELMMVLELEVSRRYSPGAYQRIAAMPEVPVLRDTTLMQGTKAASPRRLSRPR